MFKLTVINLKKLVKKIIILIVFIIMLIILLKFSKKLLLNCFNIINLKYEKIISSEMSFANYEKIGIEKGLQMILSSELVMFENEDVIEEANSDNVEEKNISEEDIKGNVNLNEEQAVENSSYEIDYKNLKTQVVNEKNLKESYNIQYGTTKIKNESNYPLSQELLKPDIEYTNTKDIVIFHTHTCESYTPTEENSYVPSGNYRTIDLRYSVVAVGDVLEDCLNKKGYNVNHDKTYHDYPAYTGSYNRSLNTVKNILENNSETNVQTVIDLHRDAVGSDSSYGPTVIIGEEKVAQLMFVIGTNGGGLEHPNWNKNLKYAIKIQEKANEMFPGLFRPIIVRNSRYNQHLADSAFIVEVGATGNTLEECKGSMKYFAEVLNQVIKSN